MIKRTITGNKQETLPTKTGIRLQWQSDRRGRETSGATVCGRHCNASKSGKNCLNLMLKKVFRNYWPEILIPFTTNRKSMNRY